MAGIAGVVWGLASLARLATQPVLEDLLPTQVAEPQTDFLTLHERLVAFREMGSGHDAVVFLHCFAGNLETWRVVQTLLAPAYHTVALDLWGFGASARPATLSQEDWPVQVLEVMDALRMPHAVLVGHSLGGRVALTCAAVAPERVRGMVLIGSDGLHLPQSNPHLRALSYRPLLHLVQRRLLRHPQMLESLLRESYPRDYPITEPLVQRYLRPLRVQGNLAALDHLSRTYPGKDSARLLERVHCPSLLLWGTEDRVTALPYVLHLMRRLPVAELVVLSRIAHLPHEECPEIVAEHIERFIRQCR